jgi:hypothetical protein
VVGHFFLKSSDEKESGVTFFGAHFWLGEVLPSKGKPHLREYLAGMTSRLSSVPGLAWSLQCKPRTPCSAAKQFDGAYPGRIDVKETGNSDFGEWLRDDSEG